MSKCILVVEDHEDNRQVLRDLLATSGFDMIEAWDGEAALTTAASKRPDLILMDIQLPGLDGCEVTRRLKADPTLAHIPIIAVTSYALSGDDAKASLAGCDMSPSLIARARSWRRSGNSWHEVGVLKGATHDNSDHISNRRRSSGTTAQIEHVVVAVAALEQHLMAWHRSNPVSKRLATIPGIGPIIAMAVAATAADPTGFRNGREFAAWLGLVPRQNSTGGKTRLGGISKRGNRYLRRLLINGASANLLRSKATNADPWVIGLRRRRLSLVVPVALANKTARIAWAVMHRQEDDQRMAAA
jgi:CheY-like chemotaxis protein